MSTTVVIGSGPAGVACARALAERGHRVTILDVGRGPDPAVTTRYAPLSSDAPAEWDPALVEDLRSEFAVGRDELPPKPVLGSLHPYATDDPSAPVPGNGVGLVPSLGRGGLSAVWGASMLPYREEDLAGWPLDARALAPFYRSVLEFVPLAGRRDALEAEFPLYVEHPTDLEPTAQIAALLADLERGRNGLGEAGLLAGRSRLAVRTVDGVEGSACRRVGLCLHGCPLGSIWSAAQELGALTSRWPVTYVPDAYAERVEEDSRGATVTARRAGARERFGAERVFIAAGVLPSARLMLHSLDAFGESLELRDSQYYTFPLIRHRGSKVSVAQQGNTLAQAFLELNDSDDPSRSAHLQVYGYSDLILREAAAMLRLPPALVERLAAPALSRLLYCQGYLHSDLSRSISAELGGGGSDAPLHLQPLGSVDEVRGRVEAVLRRLRGVARDLRATPLRRLLRVWDPGRGAHTGGSFPMSVQPTGLQSDLLGRPAGLRRIHLVDASVFPTVPPTTITLTVMANAQRIAAEHAED